MILTEVAAAMPVGAPVLGLVAQGSDNCVSGRLALQGVSAAPDPHMIDQLCLSVDPSVALDTLASRFHLADAPASAANLLQASATARAGWTEHNRELGLLLCTKLHLKSLGRFLPLDLMASVVALPDDRVAGWQVLS
ncbi:MAG: hypothetical protein ACRYGP_28560 [Janthinobacterium lividum]